jgi:predicted small lipoprotein YifL
MHGGLGRALNPGAAMCAVIAAAALAGCGSKGGTTSPSGSATASSKGTVDTAQVEQGIETSLSTSSVKVSTVKCPSDIPSNPGQTFTCSVTLTNSATGDVTVTQEKGRNNFTYAFKEGSFQIPGAAVDAELEKSLASQGYPNTTVNCPSNIIIKVGTTVTCNVSGSSGLASGQVTFTFTSATGEVGSVTP